MIYKIALLVFGTWTFLNFSIASAEQLSADTSILDFKLAMTKDLVEKSAEQQFPESHLTKLPVIITLGTYKKEATAGIVFDALPNGTDRTKILYNPNQNSSDIFAISRDLNYGGSGTILVKTLHDSLLEKYGKPLKISESGGYMVLIWASNPATYNASCAPEAAPYRPYFYEDVYAANALDARPIDSQRDETSRGFVNFLNRLDRHDPKLIARAKCGIILTITVRARVGASSEYAYEMRETLVDLTKGAAALEIFHSDLTAGADREKKTKILQDSESKPKL